MVLDVRPLRAIAPTPETVTVGAGARLGEIYDALDPHGLTIAGGCRPTVGISGLVLGGGLGILGRRHGLTCDQPLAAEVVLADGRAVRCDEAERPDLFWGLRGAGGCRFGVVTSLVLRTLRAPLTTALQLRWSFADAVPVVDAWQRWSPDAPVEGHVADLVARAGAGPESADVRELGWRAAKRHLADTGPGDVPATAHAFAKSEFFRTPVPAGVVATLVAEFAAGRRAGEHRSLDFSPWGGAYVRPRDDATAFAHRAERFLLKHETAVAPELPRPRAARAGRGLPGREPRARTGGPGRLRPGGRLRGRLAVALGAERDDRAHRKGDDARGHDLLRRAGAGGLATEVELAALPHRVSKCLVEHVRDATPRRGDASGGPGATGASTAR